MKVWVCLELSLWDADGSPIGTLLIPDAINSTAAARTFLEDQTRGIANDATAQNDLIDKVLTLYPDDPAQGSPFGTGNNTFGRSAAWKRVSAIYGDILFHAPRRQWTSDSSKLGVKNFVYYFADPQPGDLGGASFIFHSNLDVLTFKSA